MPHVAAPAGVPGLASLVAFKRSTGEKLLAFVNELLRGPSPLTSAERELIAAFVSSRNDCYFCSHAHQAVASHLLDDEGAAACAVIEDPASAPVSEKMRALLQIAAKVQRSGKEVTEADIESARAAGATDEDIHDAVLVASTFCMLNRYVDGLAATTPTDEAMYTFIGSLLAQQGYHGQLADGPAPS
jgi:uncharacterized peroxidase-related enzyme